MLKAKLHRYETQSRVYYEFITSFLLVDRLSRATSPVQPYDRNNTDTNHQSRTDASTSLKSNALKHLGEPEGTDEAPDLADKGDEHTDTSGFFLVTVNSIGDKDCGDDLVSDGSDGGTDKGCDIPFHGVIGLDEEDNVTDNTKKET